MSHELCFPVPREKVRQTRHGDVGQSCQDIGQPGLRVDVVHLGGDDEGIHEGGAFATAGRTGEEPCLAAKGDPAQGALGGVVRQTDAAIVEEPGCRVALAVIPEMSLVVM